MVRGLAVAAAAAALVVTGGAQGEIGAPPINVTAPTIVPAGSYTWPGTYTATPGTWIDPNNSRTDFTYVWEVCDTNGANCTQIPHVYTGQTLDWTAYGPYIGSRLRVTVIARTAAAGEARASSAPTPPLEEAPPAPVHWVPPPPPAPPPPPLDPAEVSGSLSARSAFVGDEITYTASVHNRGSTALENATLGITGYGSNPLSGWKSSRPAACWSSAGSADIVCPLGSLAPGDTATASVTVDLAAPGGVNFYAFFNADGHGATTSDTATAAAATPVADVAVTASPIRGLHRVGRAFRKTLHIVNHGPQPVHPILALHGRGVEFESVRPGAGCRGARCTFPPLASGASENVTVLLRPTRAGAVSFAAASRPTAAMDPVVSNDSAILRLRATRR